MHNMTRHCVLLCTVLFFFSSQADSGSLKTFSRKEINSLIPAMDRGVISLIESDAKGKLKQITVATTVNAGAGAIFSLISEPEGYGKFLNNFEGIKVRQSHGANKAFKWNWVGSRINLGGEAMLTTYPPRRADIAIVKSDLGKGHFRFDIRQVSKKKSRVTLALFIEVDSSNWIIKLLTKKHPIMRQGMNLANGYMFLTGLKRAAEAREKGLKLKPIKGKSGGKQKPLDPAVVKSIEAVSDRGPVGFTVSNQGGRLQSASIVQRVNATAGKISSLIEDPAGYQSFLSLVKDIKVTYSDPVKTQFSWKLGFPISTLSSNCLLIKKKSSYSLSVSEGDLQGSKWYWQIYPRGEKQSLLSMNGWLNIAKSNFLFRAMLEREPLTEHGVNISSAYVFTSGIRGRAEGWK